MNSTFNSLKITVNDRNSTGQQRRKEKSCEMVSKHSHVRGGKNTVFFPSLMRGQMRGKGTEMVPEKEH